MADLIQNYPVAGTAVPQIQGEGSVWQGLISSGVIPERYLPRGADDLAAMAFITRGQTKFLSMIHTQIGGKSKTVNTREHRTHQIDELDRVLDVTVNSTSADNHSSFAVPNAQAAQLQENDVLFVRGLYSVVDGNNVHFSNAFGEIGGRMFTQYEQVIVTGTEGLDSAGVGNSRVRVRRCFYGRGAGDFQGGVVNVPVSLGDDAAINSSYKILRGLPSFPEGGDAPRGFSKNPVVDNNFTQEFKYALEWTKESEIEKTWLGKTPIEVYRMLKARQATLDIERYFLWGRKGKTMDSQGRVQYTTGGVAEYIIQDTDHILKYDKPTIEYTGLLDLVNKIMRNGGSTTKNFFCSPTLYTEFKKAFYSSGYLRYDEEATAQFDIQIESIIGAGGKLNIIPLYTMEEMGFENKALVLDMSVPSFTPVTHSGWDMKVEKGIQNPGQQIEKEQWIGIKGLERRYAQYQHMVYFTNI